eukprot:XP_017951060.1 PREDICTED: flocculation protein FLO11-like isoform X32 [Xenopus tropicalis]
MDLSTILGLLLLALNSVQVTYGNALLYPYGPGLDTINPKSDDGGSGPIQLSMKIPVFGMAFSSLYVSNNGLLSFNASIGTYVPSNVTSSLGNPFLAPFWADVYNINQGDIYYRESTNTTLLSQATTDIRRYFPNKNFSAKWVFVATWNNVSYYGSTSNKGDTFQAVLTTDGNLTFVMFNYGEIEWTTGTSGGGSSATGLGGTAALAGLNCGGTMACYVIPGSLSPSIINISSTSNVGFPGRWAFQVNDLTPGFPNVIIETTSVTTTPMETTTTKETTTPLRTTKAETTTTLTRTPMVLQTLQVTSSTETTTVPITIPTLGTTQEMSTTETTTVPITIPTLGTTQEMSTTAETRTSTASTLEATPETSLPTKTTSGLRASPLVQETSTAETTTVPITIATLGTTQEMSTTETRTSTASTLEATPETSSPTETTSSFRASPLVQETSTAETTTVPTTIPALGTTQEMSTTAETTTKVTTGSTLEATPETSSPAETTSGLRASPLVQETSTAETITVPITIPTLGTTQEMSTTEAASILTSRRVETTRETSTTAGTRAFSTPDLTLPVLETTQQTSRIGFGFSLARSVDSNPAEKGRILAKSWIRCIPNGIYFSHFLFQ